MTVTRLLAAMLAVTSLAACGGETQTGPERRTAAGEVLGGTVTDDMLPLDTVQSQSPPREPDGSATGAAEQADGERRGEDAPARASGAQAEAGPSAEPASPQPTPSETPEGD